MLCGRELLGRRNSSTLVPRPWPPSPISLSHLAPHASCLPKQVPQGSTAPLWACVLGVSGLPRGPCGAFPCRALAARDPRPSWSKPGRVSSARGWRRWRWRSGHRARAPRDHHRGKLKARACVLRLPAPLDRPQRRSGGIKAQADDEQIGFRGDILSVLAVAPRVLCSCLLAVTSYDRAGLVLFQ
jgi:hypothetical protein